MSSSRPRENYIPTLDGWRAIAIGLVMLAHASDSLNDWLAPTGLAIPIPHAVGLLGVQIFFALSGFLITSKMLEADRSAAGFSLRDFYLRRVFRILPASSVFLLIVGALSLSGFVAITAGRWLSTLFFLANYSTATGTWYVGHFWSLAVEEHFYMLWPVTFVAMRSTRARLVAVVGAILAVAIWRAVSLKYNIATAPVSMFWGRTDIVADGILCGVAVALAFRMRRPEQLLSRVLGNRAAPWILAIAVIAIECTATSNWKLALLLLSVKLALIPLAILATVLQPESVAGRFLEWGVMRWVGRISYSLYLYQQLFLVWDSAAASRLHLLQSAPLNFACAIAAAYLSYRWIETPMIRLGHRVLRPTLRFAG